MPQYPSVAREAQLGGNVIVEVTISERGAVQSTRAVTGDPVLCEAAERAVARWTFEPTYLSGAPVKVIQVVNFTFDARTGKVTLIPRACWKR
jgi:TonB family protein